MGIQQELCEEKIFKLHSISKAIICIHTRFAVKNSCISCLALMFNSSSQRMKILHKKNGFNIAMCNKSSTVFSIDQYELMAQWLRQVALSWETWVRFQQSAETLCNPSAILCSTEPVSALTLEILYCCSLCFFPLRFYQWRSRTD